VQTLGTPVSLNGANTATPTFIAPSVLFSNTLIFSLTVTNSAGVQSIVTPQSTASVIVR
jgi:large repetitive protein